ncbi:MAG: hypothetical protein ACKOCM_02900 [Cyanobacteriota bacterium]
MSGVVGRGIVLMIIRLRLRSFGVAVLPGLLVFAVIGLVVLSSLGAGPSVASPLGSPVPLSCPNPPSAGREDQGSYEHAVVSAVASDRLAIRFTCGDASVGPLPVMADLKETVSGIQKGDVVTIKVQKKNGEKPEVVAIAVSVVNISVPERIKMLVLSVFIVGGISLVVMWRHGGQGVFNY